MTLAMLLLLRRYTSFSLFGASCCLMVIAATADWVGAVLIWG